MRRAAADRFGQLEINTLVFSVAVTNQRRQAAEEIVRANGISDPNPVLNSTHFQVGSVDTICFELCMWRERFGITYITVFHNATDTFARRSPPGTDRSAGSLRPGCRGEYRAR